MESSRLSAIQKVVIVFRPDSDRAKRLAIEVAKWLEDRDIQVFSHPQQKIGVRKAYPKMSAKTKADLAVALGGDGTYLEAVRLLDGKKIPIVGVNLGSLGFLTEIRVEELYSILQATLESKMEMRPRTMLELSILSRNKKISETKALNDVVLERGSYSQLIPLSIFADNKLVSSMKADGVIVASPTGSTAYNLAAGGPILHPEVNALVVTSICPHSLTSRPLLFSDQVELCLQINDGQKAQLTVDGQKFAVITAKEKVMIRKAKCSHFILQKPDHNYFALLREKLKFGERA